MIFDKLMELRQSEEFKGFGIVRVTIREDEDFGEAIIERPDGTPQTWFWDKEREDWV